MVFVVHADIDASVKAGVEAIGDGDGADEAEALR